MKRKEMVDYLSGHSRYNTMNSWNQSTSYAANVKVHSRLELRGVDNVYEMLEQEEAFEEVHNIIEEFAERYNHTYQIGFNGRSSGYMVLYHGYKELSEYKSICTECGQRNFTTVEDNGNMCGSCGSKSRVNQIFYKIGTYSGRSMGSSDVDFYADWNREELKEEVALVKDFDKTVDKCVKAFANVCKNNEVVDKEIQVTKTVKVLKTIK